MYVIPDNKFCFIAEPRTGSKAIAKALTEKYDAILIGSHHTVPSDTPEFKIDSSWTVCAAHRNHWDTMVSWWFKIERRGRMTPLAEFMPRFCRDNPSYVQDGKLWWRSASFITVGLRYAWLNADLDHALVGAGLAPLTLPRYPDSARDSQPYQIFYKQGTAEWVRHYFTAEINQCGYKF